MSRYNPNYKYIIFGTGSVAKRIYDKLLEENITPEFFIDSMLSKNEFCNRKVYKLNYLSEIPANDYHYLLGSIGNVTTMRYELIQLGIMEDNIESFMDFSEAGFEKRVKNVNNILIYPECNNQEYEQLNKNLDKYLCYKEHVTIDIKNNEFDWSNLDISEYDVVLVWNQERLYDEYLDSSNVVFCIDNNFYFAIMERILLRLSYKINCENTIIDFKTPIKNNFSRLLSQNYTDAYVFGNGPSLEQGLELYKKHHNKKSCAIVCNAYVNINSDNTIVPHVYCFEDVGYLSENRFSIVLAAMEYACKYNCFFIVPTFWLPYLYKFTPLILNHIIGYDLDAHDVTFPTVQELSICCKGGNVVTAVSIPFASTITKTIYICGCDGTKKKKQNWEYSSKIINITSSDLSLFDWDDYGEKHNNYFENLLKYGEQNGNKYICITNSYIDCLTERIGNIT